MKSLLAQFSVQLRHHREACDLSQQELAEKINIGYRTYQRYETGESTPSLDVIFQLSIVLNFKLDEIFSPEKAIDRNLDVKFFNENNEQLDVRIENDISAEKFITVLNNILSRKIKPIR